VLSERLGYTDQAIKYYSFLISDKSRSLPEYYLTLSNLFDQTRNTNKALAVIAEGRKNFPKQKDLLFREINGYADNGSYEMVAKLVEQALELEPDNLSLIYLAGFSFESIGKRERAEKYYKDLLSLEENNYEGNYALGLLYLNTYLKSSEKNQLQLAESKKYLIQASEVNPNAENVLKSLAILYTITGNTTELKRVKNKLGQIF
jgi:tetratricopeptide (TPR) repeat protein